MQHPSELSQPVNSLVCIRPTEGYVLTLSTALSGLWMVSCCTLAGWYALSVWPPTCMFWSTEERTKVKISYGLDARYCLCVPTIENICIISCNNVGEAPLQEYLSSSLPSIGGKVQLVSPSIIPPFHQLSEVVRITILFILFP